jgi:hypothetical protein
VTHVARAKLAAAAPVGDEGGRLQKTILRIVIDNETYIPRSMHPKPLYIYLAHNARVYYFLRTGPTVKSNRPANIRVTIGGSHTF